MRNVRKDGLSILGEGQKWGDSSWVGSRVRRMWRETGHTRRWGGKRIPKDDSWVWGLRKGMDGGGMGGVSIS